MKKFKRSKNGQVVATADLLLTVPLAILGSFFLIDAGLISYYKNKVSQVVTESAEYAVNLPAQEDPVTATEKMVEKLSTKNGLKAFSIKTTVKKVCIDDVDAISVSVNMNLPMVHCQWLPASSVISDTAVSLIPANKVCAVVSISPSDYARQYAGRGLSIYVPIVQPRRNLPVWSFPFDTAIGSVSVVKGVPPAVDQSHANKEDDYFAGRESVY